MGAEENHTSILVAGAATVSLLGLIVIIAIGARRFLDLQAQAQADAAKDAKTRTFWSTVLGALDAVIPF